MSLPTAQQATKNKKTISVTNIRFSVRTEMTEESKRYLSLHKKLGHNRILKLEDMRSWLQIDFLLRHKVIMLQHN